LKHFKKTIFWFIALVVIGGALVLTDDRVEEAKRVEEINLRLLPFDIDAITGFRIGAAGEGVKVRAEQSKDGWRLTEPLAAKGDDEAIGNMLKNIVKSRKDAILFETPEPAKLKELGLETPKLNITFETGGGETTILFGDKGPTLNVTYAMFGGDRRVYRIHSDVRNEADTTAFALRDKSTLVFDPVKMSRFQIVRRGGDIVTIVQDRGRWDMVEPMPARANQTTVLETLFAIKDTPVKAFIDEAPEELASYGLETPRITVIVLEKGKKTSQVLRIGDKDRARRGYFAKVNADKPVVLLEENLIKSLLAGKEKWQEQN